jgi:hypothetical protein
MCLIVAAASLKLEQQRNFLSCIVMSWLVGLHLCSSSGHASLLCLGQECGAQGSKQKETIRMLYGNLTHSSTDKSVYEQDVWG